MNASKAVVANTEAVNPVQMLPLTSLRESTTNQRRTFDEKALQELAESIKRQGVLQPILARPKGNGHEIVAGARRFRATKLAGVNVIPAIVRTLTDNEAIEIQVIENLQREDLHELDEALGYQALRERDPKLYTVETIAAKVGKSPSYVYARLQLAQLVPNIQKAFYDGKLSAGHATEICRLQPREQELVFQECFRQKIDKVLKDKEAEPSVSVRELRHFIREEVHLDLSKAPFDVKDAELLPAAGACVSCPKRVGNNPLLFPDITKKDTCTDPGCHGEKKNAFIQIQIKGVQAQAKQQVDVVKISTRHGFYGEKKPQGVLPASDYTLASAKCEKTQKAVFVDGERFGKVVEICKSSACKEHRSSSGRSSYTTSPAEQAARKKQLRAQRIQQAYRTRLLRDVKAKLPGALGNTETQLLASYLLGRMDHDSTRRLVRLYAWEEKKTKSSYGGESVDFRKIARTQVNALKTQDLARFVMVCTMLSDLYIPGYNPSETLEGDSLLSTAAKRYKVDAAKVMTAVKADLDRKKALQTSAKSSSKKGGK